MFIRQERETSFRFDSIKEKLLSFAKYNFFELIRGEINFIRKKIISDRLKEKNYFKEIIPKKRTSLLVSLID